MSAAAVHMRQDHPAAYVQRPGAPELRAYQDEATGAILESAWNERGLTFTVVMARQAGKNELSAEVELLLLSTNFLRDVSGVKCAPTFEPQGRISLARLWSRILGRGIQENAGLEGRAVRFGRARMLFLSAEPSANVVGHTAGTAPRGGRGAGRRQREVRPRVPADGSDRRARRPSTTARRGTTRRSSNARSSTNLELAAARRRPRHFQADWTARRRAQPGLRALRRGRTRQRLGENHPLFLTQYALKTISGARAAVQRLAARAAPGDARAADTRRAMGRRTSRGWTSAGRSGVVPSLKSPKHGKRAHDATVLTIARSVDAAERCGRAASRGSKSSSTSR